MQTIIHKKTNRKKLFGRSMIPPYIGISKDINNEYSVISHNNLLCSIFLTNIQNGTIKKTSEYQ